MDTWTDHDCVFDQVIIESADEDENLKVGMQVLLPCRCGETPLDAMSILEREHGEMSDTILAIEPRRSLFHWAPTTRRKQITRYGLRPRMRNTTSTTAKAPTICLGDSPSWAWALSGGMSYTPPGSWDLWETTLDLVTDPVVLAGPERASGIYEVRTEHRIYKRHLWFIGTRTKP